MTFDSNMNAAITGGFIGAIIGIIGTLLIGEWHDWKRNRRRKKEIDSVCKLEPMKLLMNNLKRNLEERFDVRVVYFRNSAQKPVLKWPIILSYKDDVPGIPDEQKVGERLTEKFHCLKTIGLVKFDRVKNIDDYHDVYELLPEFVEYLKKNNFG